MTDASLQISQLPQDSQMVPMPKIPKDGGIMWNPIEYMQLVGCCFGKSRVSDGNAPFAGQSGRATNLKVGDTKLGPIF